MILDTCFAPLHVSNWKDLCKTKYHLELPQHCYSTDHPNGQKQIVNTDHFGAVTLKVLVVLLVLFQERSEPPVSAGGSFRNSLLMPGRKTIRRRQTGLAAGSFHESQPSEANRICMVDL